MKRFVSLLAMLVIVAACGAGSSSNDQVPDDLAATTSPSTEPLAAPTSMASDAPSTDTDGGIYPVTVVTPVGDLTIDERPESILSLSPAATEMLFAIGAGSQVVAVDSLSNYPPEAPVTELAAFTPNVEAILEFKPDLVVASFDPGELASGLAAAGVPVLFQFSAVTLDDVYAQIEQLGLVTGNTGGAAELNSDLQERIAAVVDTMPEFEQPPTYYHELDPTYFTATSSTFIGEIYGLLGLANIADAADPDGEFFGFPQLSEEFILEANPDFVFLADTKCCDVTVATVAARPGWSGLAAVTEANVIELDDDVASRWGPRIVDYLEQVAAAVAESAG